MATRKQLKNQKIVPSHPPIPITSTIFQVDVEWVLAAYASEIQRQKLDASIVLNSPSNISTVHSEETSSLVIENFIHLITQICRISPNAYQKLHGRSWNGMNNHFPQEEEALSPPMIWISQSKENSDISPARFLANLDYGRQFIRRCVFNNLNEAYDTALSLDQNPPLIDEAQSGYSIGHSLLTDEEISNRLFNVSQLDTSKNNENSTPLPARIRPAEIHLRWTGILSHKKFAKNAACSVQVLPNPFSPQFVRSYAFPQDIVPRVRYLRVGCLHTLHYKRLQMAVEAGEADGGVLEQIIIRERLEMTTKGGENSLVWMDMSLEEIVASIGVNISNYFYGTRTPDLPTEEGEGEKEEEEDREEEEGKGDPTTDRPSGETFLLPDSVESGDQSMYITILHLDDNATKDRVTVDTILQLIDQTYQQAIHQPIDEAIHSIYPCVLFYDHQIAERAGTLPLLREARQTYKEYAEKIYDKRAEGMTSTHPPIQLTRVVEWTNSVVEHFLKSCKSSALWSIIATKYAETQLRKKTVRDISFIMKGSGDCGPLRVTKLSQLITETQRDSLFMSSLRDVFYRMPLYSSLNTKGLNVSENWRMMENHTISRYHVIDLVVGEMEAHLSELLIAHNVTQVNLLAKITHDLSSMKDRGGKNQDAAQAQLQASRATTEADFRCMVEEELGSLNNRLRKRLRERFWRDEVAYLDFETLRQSIDKSPEFDEEIMLRVTEMQSKRRVHQLYHDIIRPRVVISKLDVIQEEKREKELIQKTVRRNLFGAFEEVLGEGREDVSGIDITSNQDLIITPDSPSIDLTRTHHHPDPLTAGFVTPVTLRTISPVEDHPTPVTKIISPLLAKKALGGPEGDVQEVSPNFPQPVETRRIPPSNQDIILLQRHIERSRVGDLSEIATTEAKGFLQALETTRHLILQEVLESRSEVSRPNESSVPFFAPLLEDEEKELTKRDYDQILGDRLRVLSKRNALKRYCNIRYSMAHSTLPTPIDRVRERLQDEECVISGQVIFYVGELTDSHGLSLNPQGSSPAFASVLGDKETAITRLGRKLNEELDPNLSDNILGEEEEDEEEEGEEGDTISSTPSNTRPKNTTPGTPISASLTHTPLPQYLPSGVSSSPYILAPGIGVATVEESRVEDMTPSPSSDRGGKIETPVFVDVSGLTSTGGRMSSKDSPFLYQAELENAIEHALYGRSPYIYPFVSNLAAEKERLVETEHPQEGEAMDAIPFNYLLDRYNHQIGNTSGIPDTLHAIKTKLHLEDTHGASKRRLHARDVVRSQDRFLTFMKKKISFLQQNDHLTEEEAKGMQKQVLEAEASVSLIADVERYTAEDCYPYIMPFTSGGQRETGTTGEIVDLSRLFIRYSLLHALIQLF